MSDCSPFPTKQVFLTSAYPLGSINFSPIWLKKNTQPLIGFEITEDPEIADLILFVENHPGPDPYFFSVKNHPLVKRYPDKCVLYHDADHAITLLRTITPCIQKWQFNPKTKASFHYIARFCENIYINEITEFQTERKYLFSFDGSSATNHIRKKIFELDCPEALLTDRGQSQAWQMTEAELEPYRRSFVQSILASHFVLCPAGLGPATFRLFECMQLARPPVIISDAWVPIDGIDWASCAIIIASKDIARIPEILKANLHKAESMGICARNIWEKHFSPEVSLQRLCEIAAKLITQPYGIRAYLKDLSQFLSPFHFRGFFRYFFRQRHSLEEWKAEILNS